MSCDRRAFLQSIAGGVAIAGGLPVLHGCGNDVAVPPYLDATVDVDPSSSRYGQVEVVVGRYPELLQPGGAATVRVPQPTGKHPFFVPDDGLLLLRLVEQGAEATPYVACDSACPHAGCPLGYNPGSGLIECPCHSSRFRAVADPADAKSCAGQVVHLPARSDLQLYAVSYDPFTQTVHIDLRRPRSCNALPAPIDGVVSVELATLPALSEVGGYLAARPEGFADFLLVIRTGPSEFVVTSAVCTHRRCTVGYDPAAMLIKCPCHGSRYDLAGMVVKGPAEKPLTPYAVAFDGTTLQITVG